jgi:uncharacterized flavoprotein (TIGR03862 family)
VDTPVTPQASSTVAVIGGGPAGLMAAEVLSRGGVQVDVYDAMPSVGRKFLLAGKGGMNLTHSEAYDAFVKRYGTRSAEVSALLQGFDPQALREWVHGLGIDTFIGSSGRVFPVNLKAAPLLRAWLHRLRAGGVRFHMRHRWLGWTEAAAVRFATPQGEVAVNPAATVLALGGGSWARLGSDGAWTGLLAQRGVTVKPLEPANCGFDIAGGWSEHFRTRFVGQPVKPAVLSAGTGDAAQSRRGEFVITASGVEGGLIYTLSALLREGIKTGGSALATLDLAPDWTLDRLLVALAHPRGARSLSSHLQSRAGITGVKAGLLREFVGKEDFQDMAKLAHVIKYLPLTLAATRPLDEAISSAGGVDFADLDANQMLRTVPGVFCAGEMLDWEAPTGGYLLSACFASGQAAGRGVILWLGRT